MEYDIDLYQARFLELRLVGAFACETELCNLSLTRQDHEGLLDLHGLSGGMPCHSFLLMVAAWGPIG